jgi:hypothetical protein
MSTFKVGDKVIMPAKPGIVEERGRIIEGVSNGIVTVRVDRCYRDEYDDGIREVLVKDVKKIS